ncbi:hisA/hisF family protein [Beggiatoa alba B18LD]|uniref:HisA/hisF family protein n=1 Tax=Beggiatoa alba B18LD TaxID=395493 RepID=I3CFX4_9GAMM|nr:HisA/HisF-related TIM barrel protein [Beggiatoa alba]EIJ42517.1 hisA/hisF family protein [Beggiatoa alba B18LD]
MQIIPVIDLLNGIVVHARAGERAQYRALQSPLADSADPVAVVHGLLHYYPFTHLYIADLNAIQGTGDNLASLRDLQQHFPQLHYWVDSGIQRFTDYQTWQTHALGTAVVGSETQLDLKQYQTLLNSAGADNFILSLDFHHDRFLGHPKLWTQPTLWVNRLILMNLSKVGVSQGVDESRLSHLQQSCPAQTHIYAAGGVRHAEDLARLQQLQVAGVLIATAIHQQTLSPDDIARFSEC